MNQNNSIEYKIGISRSEALNILGISLEDKDIGHALARAGFSYEIVSPREKIVEMAKKYIGMPYRYGASVLNDAERAFDCSSLVSRVHVDAGIAIPRISVDQYVAGKVIEEKEIKPGDTIYANSGIVKRVIYYETQEFSKGTKIPEGVDHSGIYVGNGEVVHATEKLGRVVIEKIKDSDGFKNIVGYRSHVPSSEKRFVVRVPIERVDIRTKEDLANEIGRLKNTPR